MIFIKYILSLLSRLIIIKTTKLILCGFILLSFEILLIWNIVVIAYNMFRYRCDLQRIFNLKLVIFIYNWIVFLNILNNKFCVFTNSIHHWFIITFTRFYKSLTAHWLNISIFYNDIFTYIVLSWRIFMLTQSFNWFLFALLWNNDT